MFFIAAALVLTTAGVFAGKAKFVNAVIYAYDGTNGSQLTQSAALVGLQTGGSSGPLSITSSIGGTTYGLYSFSAPSTYTRLYTTF